jgi:hypothetical protein
MAPRRRRPPAPRDSVTWWGGVESDLREPGRVALLVIRAWRDDDDAGGLRLRVSRTQDVSSQAQNVSLLTSADEVLGTVAEWLRSIGPAG